MIDWKGEAAIITGGASGLGAATAAKLAADGLRVALFDLNEDAGMAHAERIGGTFAKVDVSDPASISDGLKTAVEAHGIPRVLVNCAGIGGAS